jgi:hypothetical protein
VSTGARLGWRGTTVRGGIRWWRSVARGWGRWSGHRWSLGRRRRSASVARGGWCRWQLHDGNRWRLGAGSLEDEVPLERRWGRQLQSAVHKASAVAPCMALQLESSAEWTTRARWREGDGGENGELESGVHPLSPRKAVDGERHGGETRGGNQQWWPRLEWRRCGLGADVRTVRLSSGPNKVLIFFQFIQNWLNFKNSK